MSESAGRVLMIPKGTYSPTTTYDPLDAVKYEQNSYVCKQTSRGNLPTNTTYWQPLTDVTADENPTEDSTNLVQSGGVYSALKTINQTLMNNVNVNGCKNVLTLLTIEQLRKSNVYGTWNGNTYTYNNVVWSFEVDDNGFVTGYSASGTASGSSYGGASPVIITQRNRDEAYELFNLLSSNEYVITGRSSDNPLIVVDWSNGSTVVRSVSPQNGAKLVPPSDANNLQFELYVASGKTAVSGTFHPMICLATDYALDSSYVAPSKTNRQLTTDKVGWDDYSELGAVNLRNQDVNTKTQNGITFTVSTDKRITVSGVNDNTNPSSMILHKQTGFSKPLKVYGVPLNANNNYCCIEVYDDTSNSRIGYVTGSNPEVIIPVSNHTVTIRLYVWKNQDISTPMEFPVMITPLSYNGGYVPPAKTNKELTDDVNSFSSAGLGRVDLYDFGNTPSWLNGAFSTKTLEAIITAMSSAEGVSKLILGTGANTDTVFAQDLKAKGLHDSGTGVGYIEITKITSYQNRAIVEYTYKDSTSLKKRITSWVNGTWTTAQTIL